MAWRVHGETLRRPSLAAVEKLPKGPLLHLLPPNPLQATKLIRLCRNPDCTRSDGDVDDMYFPRWDYGPLEGYGNDGVMHNRRGYNSWRCSGEF